MRFPHKGYLKYAYVLADLLAVAGSFFAAYSLRYTQAYLWTDTYSQDYVLLCALWFVVLVFCMARYNLYVTDRILTIPEEALRVAKAVLFSCIAVIIVVFLLKMDFFSRQIFVTAALLIFATTAGWRAVKRVIVRSMVLRGYKNFNILIVGAGKSAAHLIAEIEQNPYLGLRVKGLLDDHQAESVAGVPVLGTLADIERVGHEQFVDEIYITIPSERKSVRRILTAAQKMRRTVRIVADNYEFDLRPLSIHHIGRTPLLTYNDRGIHGADLHLKRLFDLAGAGFGLLLLSPLFLLICALIVLDNPGPVFFVSKRAGRKGQVFDFYKFRTMIVNAEALKADLLAQNEVRGGFIFKIKQDPRITRVGRFLRKYSLDELPQLINVLKGDMSLIGPRPFPVEEFKKFDYFHMARAQIKPGITGLAQVRGRSDLSFRHWMKWDIWYINNWSFALDLMILLWTFPAVFKGRGAY